MEANSTLRVLVVDDCPVIRTGCRYMIERLAGFQVCGEAGSNAEVFRQVEVTRPDLILMDLAMGDGNALDPIRHIRAMHPSVRILVLSMYEEDLYAQRCLKAGAHGYLRKDAPADEFVEAIKRVAVGQTYLHAAAANRLMQRSLGRGLSMNRFGDLTDREMEVFRLTGQGHPIKRIAELLDISTKMVESHRNKIKVKLNLRTQPEFIHEAVQWVLENS